jgi:hypothetical protein
MQQPAAAAAAAAAAAVVFEYPAEDAARVSLCSLLHTQVFRAQLEVLKKSVQDFQRVHARAGGGGERDRERERERGEGDRCDARLSVDTKGPQLRVGGRAASDFECTLSALFDHQNNISLSGAVHNLIILMLKVKTVI